MYDSLPSCSFSVCESTRTSCSFPRTRMSPAIKHSSKTMNMFWSERGDNTPPHLLPSGDPLRASRPSVLERRVSGRSGSQRAGERREELWEMWRDAGKWQWDAGKSKSPLDVFPWRCSGRALEGLERVVWGEKREKVMHFHSVVCVQLFNRQSVQRAALPFFLHPHFNRSAGPSIFRDTEPRGAFPCLGPVRRESSHFIVMTARSS